MKSSLFCAPWHMIGCWRSSLLMRGGIWLVPSERSLHKTLTVRSSHDRPYHPLYLANIGLNSTHKWFVFLPRQFWSSFLGIGYKDPTVNFLSWVFLVPKICLPGWTFIHTCQFLQAILIREIVFWALLSARFRCSKFS